MPEKPLFYFIINPKSGKGNPTGLAELIQTNAQQVDADVRIMLTEGPGDIQKIALQGVQEKAAVVAVAGGDGSVHEAVQALTNSRTALGVIPMGSGNGFANHFGMPKQKKQAIQNILQNKTIRIDTLRINDRICASTAGFGFDAHIAHLFSTYGKRGFSSYVKLVLREYRSYHEQPFHLEMDGKTIDFTALLLSFTNTREFGNHASIAPLADAQDGLMEIGILHRLPVYAIPLNTIRLFTQHLHRSPYFTHYRAKQARVKLDAPTAMHIDGEPYVMEDIVDFEILPNSLNIIQRRVYTD